MVTPQIHGFALRSKRSRSQSELNLGYLRKFMRRLTAETGVNTSQEMRLALGIKIIAHINLARHNLFPQAFGHTDIGCPKNLSHQLIEHLNQKYFSTPPAFIDSSPFARALCAPLALNSDDWQGTPASLFAVIDRVIEKLKGVQFGKNEHEHDSPLQRLAENILAVGWAQESLLQLDKKVNTTQVFTPESVAQNIACEIFPDQLFSEDESKADTSDQLRHHLTQSHILDPACGAGHLLIAAGQRWLDLKISSGADPLEALQELLSLHLFGLDVDHTLLQLCGFSLYLFALDNLGRDYQQTESLALPRLYQVTSEHGSLALGVNNGKLDKPGKLDTPGKSVTLVDLAGATFDRKELPERFEQIVMNPPYLSTRIMGGALSNFLKNSYAESAGDLYTAFIDLAVRLLAPAGRLSTIVQQSFLSIQRYRQFRLALLNSCHIVSCHTLGSGTFSARPGEKVNSVILTLERKSTVASADSNGSTVQNAGEKPRTIKTTNSCVNADEAIATIMAISGNPFAFDCPPALAALFKDNDALGDADGIAIVNGLFTCNNKLFVKHISELEQLASAEKALYVPYDKGGGQKWYHQTGYRLRWFEGGKEIQDYRQKRGQSRALPGEEFYFKAGITYSYIGTSGFSARLLSKQSVFDIASSALFLKDASERRLLFILGLLNSSLSIYLLAVLNPTINFQIGDLRRLPFVTDPGCEEQVSKLSTAAIALMRHAEEERTKLSDAQLRAIAVEEEQIQAAIDTCVFDLYKIDDSTRELINNNLWVKNSRKKLFK